MKIGIVGVGVVGGAVKYGMEKLGHDVRVHDLRFDTQLIDLIKTEICFICVPTPENPDGSCDTSIVKNVVEDLWAMEYQGIIAIKSTVVPGTTKELHSARPRGGAIVCFVPEFLRERHAISDFTENHDICVVGVDGGCWVWVFDEMKKAHGKYPKQFVLMSTTEAELTKYFSNIFNAMRVTFANGFYEVCKKLGARYSVIKDAVVQRPTLTDLYLDCNEKFRGFAGVCLPKDTAAFAKLASDLDVDAGIFSTIVEDNKLYEATVSEGMRME